MPEENLREQFLQQEEEPEGRSYAVLGTVLLVILVLVVVALLYRSCQGEERQIGDSSQGGVISDVEGLAPVEGGVAIWVKEGEDVEAILARNGLGEESYTDLGAGTYVISVGERDANDVVQRLKKDESLFDAGFLYSEP